MKPVRPDRVRAVLTDSVLATVLLAVMVVGTSYAGVGQHRRGLDDVAYLLLAAIAGVVVFRRIKPLPVLVFTVGASGAYFLLGYPYGPIFFATSLALYTVGRELPLRRALMASAGAIAVLVTLELVAVPPSQVPTEALHIAAWQSWLLLPWAPLGGAWRAYREGVRRDREDEAARLAYEERLRVAREVHDVLAHSLAVINMQAGVALHVLERRPEQVRDSLEAIKQTSKHSLEELRATLAVFRQRDGSAAREPAPGLRRLDAVASAMKESGLPVQVVVSGQARPLPAAVDLAAYRIVQESLTNVLRHAGPTRATVTVTYEPEQLIVEVLDGGRGRAGSDVNSGHGLVGMRERVQALGGTLEAGPRQAGGFRVLARLPMKSAT